MLQTTPWKLSFVILSDEHIRMLFNSLIAASLSFLFSIYKDCSWTRRIAEGLICAILAWFVVDLLSLLNIAQEWGIHCSMLIGLLGADDIRKGIKSLCRRYRDKKGS